MPVLEVTLEQQYEGQQIINRWNYLGAGTPAAVFHSFALASALGAIFDTLAGEYPDTGLMRKIADVQVTEVTFVSLRVLNVYDNIDFYDTPFVPDLTGEQTDPGMPPTSALGFRTNIIRRDIRRGTKRFVGISEGIQSEGRITGASGQIAALTAAMNQVRTYDDEGNTLTYTPAVCRRQKYDPATGLASETGTAYRYFPTEVEQEENMAIGVQWQAYDTVRTQTSRQFGRGR